jgi:hypothetical protein
VGWAGGSEVGDQIWNNIRGFIPEGSREEAARIVINALEDQDCDTIYECEQLVIDAGLEDEYWPEEGEE